MGRYSLGGRRTCESCNSLDVRYLHREGKLRPGRRSGLRWMQNGEPSGSIGIAAKQDAIVSRYRTRGYGETEWQDIRQYVPIIWTDCSLGGRRPWFTCPIYSNGRYCGRCVAKLYQAGDLFACRHCYGLTYQTQKENPRDRAISRVQKMRMRLGGSPNLLEPFPEKPLGMHWRTYRRLRAEAIAADERSTALMVDDMRRRYPGLLQGPVRVTMFEMNRYLAAQLT
jgi:hypothetical protein